MNRHHICNATITEKIRPLHLTFFHGNDGWDPWNLDCADWSMRLSSFY